MGLTGFGTSSQRGPRHPQRRLTQGACVLQKSACVCESRLDGNHCRVFLHFHLTTCSPVLPGPCTDLSDGQSGPVDLLSLQSSLGPGLDNVGAEEGPEGPKFCPIGILIVRRWAQLCQNRGTVFLQREGKEQPGRGRAVTLRRGEKGGHPLFQCVPAGSQAVLGYQCVRNAVVFLHRELGHQLVGVENLLSNYTGDIYGPQGMCLAQHGPEWCRSIRGSAGLKSQAES